MVANQFGESEPHQGEGPQNILVPRIISPMEKILQWMGIPATARPSIISQLDDDVTGLHRMDPGSVHTLAKHLRHQDQSFQLGLVGQEKLKRDSYLPPRTCTGKVKCLIFQHSIKISF